MRFSAEFERGFPVHWVFMKMRNNSSRTTKEIFEYTSDEDYGFKKTIVPVRLAQYGDELLVSRSQSKRLLSRIDRFETVILDFDGVRSIGKAFADEIFRVFALNNRNINMYVFKGSPFETRNKEKCQGLSQIVFSFRFGFTLRMHVQ